MTIHEAAQLSDELTVISADVLDNIPWTPIHEDLKGISQRVLSRTSTSLAGVMTIEPGAWHPSTAYPELERHMCVLSGSVVIGEQVLTAGSYLRVGYGVESGDLRSGLDGGIILFLMFGKFKTNGPSVEEVLHDHDHEHDHDHD